MSDHARLSPSASSRWLTCTASVKAIEAAGRPDTAGPAAREGAAAHALAEIALTECVKGQVPLSELSGTDAYESWALGYPGYDLDEMLRHVCVYAEYVAAQLSARPGGQLLVEARLETGVSGLWGTTDAALVWPDHAEIIDFKYGSGVVVDAHENPQMMSYGLGVLHTRPLVERLVLTIVQPRAGVDPVRSWPVSATELRAWRRWVVEPAAAAALNGQGRFAPSESACRWCPLAGSCRARSDDIMAQDFGHEAVPELSPSELGAAADRVAEIRSWCNAVEAATYAAIYERGQDVPGWKVVQRGGRRTVADRDDLAARLAAVGIEAYEPKLKGFTVLDRLAGGRAALAELAGPSIATTAGSPSLVKASAPGEPVAVSAEDFF